MLELKIAKECDSAAAMALIDQAKAHLKAQGIDQWQTGYPDLPCIQADIACQRGYFLTDRQNILGYLCIDFQGEPAYADLKGSWKSAGPYAVVHRLAFSDTARGKGLATQVFSLVQEVCVQRDIHSIRVDTDEDNQAMRHILHKSGFSFCGTIWFDNSEKIAFEKTF